MESYKKSFSEKLFTMAKGALNKEQCDIIATKYSEEILSDTSNILAHKSMEFYIKDILDNLKSI